MDLDLVFLGTSASMPTALRAPAAFLVRRGGERLLFDCAEGTQRQLQRSAVGLPDLEEIFLTHLHADHVLGLPGMLKTFALRGRDEVGLTVYGPKGVRDLFGKLKPFLGRLPYPLTIVELAPKETLDRGEYVIETFPVDHGVSAVGYALVEHERPGQFDVAAADALGVPAGRERGILQGGGPVTLADGSVVTPDAVLGPARPGRKLVITGDTAPAPSVVQAAHRADLLVHEATFADGEKERARETLHATAAEAAEVARLAEVKLLALTHVSTRYFGAELARQARAIFPETVVPRDFDVVDIPFAERGGPQLLKGAGRPPRKLTYDQTAMSRMIQVAAANDVTEAEGLQELLRNAGIEAEVEAADGEDGLMVMVPETTLEAAQDAIEALSEPDDLIVEP
ncbi:MAG TPA: ribonuclease Z [Gaiellaceae bacterium]|nr:ribonuclease Z [Gaiellaceae bacterium]